MADPFDSVADAYETNRLGPWYRAHGEFILQHLPADEFATVLDIGCGTGWLLRAMIERGLAVRGIGIDASPRMIERARSAGAGAGDRLRFVHASWPDLPAGFGSRLREETIDLVVCASSVHYFDDIGASLNACRPLIASGGWLAILERAPERSAITRLWGHLHESVLKDGVRFVTTEELLAAMEAAGFEGAGVAATLRRYLWKGKLVTSMALCTGRRP